VRNESALNNLAPDTTNQTPSGTSSGLAWQLAAGVGIAVTSNLTLDVGYRYVDLGSIKVDQGRYNYVNFTPNTDTNGLKGDLRTHELALGLRYSF
jgi:opacity protein-like surface antigen